MRFATSPHDHVRDLGPDIMVEHPGLEALFYRFDDHPEWDAFEISMAKYAGLAAQGRDDLVGLPAFPSRAFRHGSIYVRAGLGPGDLRGGRIGLPDWTQTTSVYARAVLVHECGIGLDAVRWVQAGVDRPDRGALPAPQLAGIDCATAPDRALSDMLLAGEIDALIATQPPRAWGDPGVARLFPDPVEVEADYFRRTGIHPIMHAVVLRRAAVDRRPDLPRRMFAALVAARRRSRNDDAWRYGLAANRHTLDAFLGFALEQQAIGSLPDPARMFLPFEEGEGDEC